MNASPASRHDSYLDDLDAMIEAWIAGYDTTSAPCPIEELLSPEQVRAEILAEASPDRFGDEPGRKARKSQRVGTIRA